jgi:hypothetical protein
MKHVGEYGPDGEGNAKRIEPTRTSNRGGASGSRRRKIGTQAELQEQCGHPNRSDHDQSHGTEERPPAGIENNQSKSCKQQTGCNDSRSARLRIGTGVRGVGGHVVSSQDLYRR